MDRIVMMIVRMGINMLMRKGMRAGMNAVARRQPAPRRAARTGGPDQHAAAARDTDRAPRG